MSHFFSISPNEFYGDEFINGLLNRFSPLDIAGLTIIMPHEKDVISLMQYLRRSEKIKIYPKIVSISNLDFFEEFYQIPPIKLEKTILNPLQSVGYLSKIIQNTKSLHDREGLYLAREIFNIFKFLEFSNPHLKGDQSAPHGEYPQEPQRQPEHAFLFQKRPQDFNFEQFKPHLKSFEALDGFSKDIFHEWCTFLDEHNFIDEHTHHNIRIHSIIDSIKNWNLSHPHFVCCGFETVDLPYKSLFSTLQNLKNTYILQKNVTELTPWHASSNTLASPPQKTIKTIAAKTLFEEGTLIADLIRSHINEYPNSKIGILGYDDGVRGHIYEKLRYFGILEDASYDFNPHLKSLIKLSADCLVKKNDESFLSLLKHPLYGQNPIHKNAIHFLEHLCRGRHKQPIPKTTDAISGLNTNENCDITKYLQSFLTAFFNIILDADATSSFSNLIEYHKRLILLGLQEKGALYDLEEASQDLEEASSNQIEAQTTQDISHQNPHPAFTPVSDFFKALNDGRGAYSHISPSHYRDICDMFMPKIIAPITPRLKFDNICITTPEHTTFQKFDTVILFGLCDDIWPGDVEVLSLLGPKLTPFINPDVVRQHHEKQQTFWDLLYPQNIYISHHATRDGVATTKSRMVQTLCTNHDCFENITPKLRDINCAQIPAIEGVQTTKPVPSPPVAARPKHYSVSDIEILRRDPYALYAKSVLKLRPLNDFATAPSAQDRGNVFHEILEIYTKSKNSDLVPEIYLKSIAKQCIHAKPFSNYIKTLWLEQFLNIAPWILAEFPKKSPNDQYAEVFLEKHIKINNDTIRIFGIADRIDVFHDHIEIIDYKTGQIPKKSDLRDGYAPQLLLLGFLHPENNVEIAYWHLKTKPSDCAIIPIDFKNIETQLTTFLTSYHVKNMPYRACPDMDHAPGFQNYHHLERFEEWR